MTYKFGSSRVNFYSYSYFYMSYDQLSAKHHVILPVIYNIANYLTNY